MLFTSLTFFIFFLFVYTLYWLLPGRLRKNLLIAASIIFYASWSLPFMLHFGTIIIANHLLNRQIIRSKGKTWIYASLALNGSNLFFFKYFYFGIQIFGDLLGTRYISPPLVEAWFHNTLGFSALLLPLAISFYTFQLTAYAIDLHRRIIDEPFSLTEFTLFIMFFPQLIAGPIMRYSDFALQIRDLRNIAPRHDMLTGGLYLVLTGLAKKMLVANNMIAYNQAIFENPGKYNWVSLISACLGFSAQLYCDFSGYTDLARGFGKLMGLQLPENFFTPYFSQSVRELWNNWHRTLTIWLRDYIYIPLGGHRTSFFRAQFNIIVTMALCGLWHGASYNFLILGLYHGLLIAFESAWLRYRGLLRTSPDKIFPAPIKKFSWPFRFLKALLVYFLLNAGFVLFRTPDFGSALNMYQRMLSRSPGIVPAGMENVGYSLVAVLFFHLLQMYGSRFKFGTTGRYLLLAIAGFILLLLLGNLTPGEYDFFYFQF